MAVTLVGSNGLMTRIGRIGGWINSILNAQGAAALTAPSVSAGVAYTNLLAQFTSGSAQSDLFDTFVSTILTPARQKSATISQLKSFAQALLIRQVNDDTPLKSYTLPYAMDELIRQMGPTVSDSKVTKNTVAASATSQLATFPAITGGALLTSSVVGPIPWTTTTGANGLDLQFVLPESLLAICTADSYTGGATQYQEGFSVLGQTALVTDPLTWNYSSLYNASATNGSGSSAALNVCNAAVYQGSGAGANLLNNGDMSQFTSHSPNQWTAVAGTPNTDFTDTGAGTSGITGGQCLKLLFAGNAFSLTQQFGSGGGTSSVLQPNSVYCGNVWMKRDGSATGTVVIDLIDGTNTVVNDNNGTANSVSVTVGSLLTSYTATYPYTNNAVPFFFRTPAVLPSVYKIRVRSTSNITTAAAYIGGLALRAAVQPYSGGPYLGMFSGAVPSVKGDSYLAPVTNDFGGLTNKMGFQALFNALFDMRLMTLPGNTFVGAQLPVVGSTLLPDSLVA